MHYTTFGRTGATVSRLGFGGAVLGLANYLGEFDPDDLGTQRELEAAIETALEVGVNYFDTAEAYGNGRSERLLGSVLAGVTQSGGHPLFLSTKVHPGRWEGDVRASLEASLGRLQRDRVDLLQIHGDSIPAELAERHLAPGGMVEQLRALQNEGLVGSIGFTTEDNNDSVYRLIRSGSFDTIQLCYNLLFQHPYESTRPFGSLLEAEQQQMGVLAMRAPTSGTFQRWIQAVNPDNTFDYTPGLIQFVLSNPLIDVALVGMRSAERVRSNAAIVDDLDGRLDIAAIHERYV